MHTVRTRHNRVSQAVSRAHVHADWEYLTDADYWHLTRSPAEQRLCPWCGLRGEHHPYCESPSQDESDLLWT